MTTTFDDFVTEHESSADVLTAPDSHGEVAPSTCLVVATPVDGGDIWTARVSFGYSEHLRCLSHEMAVPIVVGFARDVVRARNRVVARILRNIPQMTHVLWWDEDNWPEDRRIVREMMASGEDLIGAAYTNKRHPTQWVHQLLKPCPDATSGVQLVRAIGFGFTMTSRACLERMTKAHRKYRDWPNEERCSDIFGHLFDAPDMGSEYYCPEEDELKLSEDFSFCKRWRELGGRVALKVDAGIVVHSGSYGFSARDMKGGVIG